MQQQHYREKEGRAYSLSEIHRNTSLESIYYHTTSPKTHTNTHILIFNPVRLAHAIFHPCKFMRCNVVSGLGYGSPLHLGLHLLLKLFTRALGVNYCHK